MATLEEEKAALRAAVREIGRTIGSALLDACPHPFGWSYNTSRRVRFCRLCGVREIVG